ncbi:hypothetical protein [Streptomyces sp. MAR4 CNX-425]|uniref:hypothetical protein n=1 Tax=Streptomyces sp. MAR4 CNX-425 TaxID=3406343 RepID=UPI003B50DC3B
MRRRRLSAALATLTLAAALGTTATAAAAPATDDPGPLPVCATGYVCVHHDLGVVTLVPEGNRHTFDPAVRTTAVVNSTKIPYCIGGTYNTGVGPGDTFTPPVPYATRSLTPSPDGICLTTD